jgi:hypothetical protein
LTAPKRDNAGQPQTGLQPLPARLMPIDHSFFLLATAGGFVSISRHCFPGQVEGGT